jgi:hypothetical protein
MPFNSKDEFKKLMPDRSQITSVEGEINNFKFSLIGPVNEVHAVVKFIRNLTQQTGG